MQLRVNDRESIVGIARQTLPLATEIWAYGSRVNGTAHDTSDLDLVVRGNHLAAVDVGALADFREALTTSTIPILIQVFDWATIPARFHTNILQCYEVLTVIGDGNE